MLLVRPNYFFGPVAHLYCCTLAGVNFIPPPSTNEQPGLHMSMSQKNLLLIRCKFLFFLFSPANQPPPLTTQPNAMIVLAAQQIYFHWLFWAPWLSQWGRSGRANPRLFCPLTLSLFSLYCCRSVALLYIRRSIDCVALLCANLTEWATRACSSSSSSCSSSNLQE